MNYENPIGVAVVLIPVRKSEVWEDAKGVKHVGKNGVLGVMRNLGPKGIALPGGFQNKMETTRQAAVRELKEETGLEISGKHLVHYDERITDKNYCLHFWKYEFQVPWEMIEQLKFDPVEVQELVFIEKETELCFPIHQEMVEKILW